MQRIRCLSGNTLKIIAAIAMLIDHIGVIFYPQNVPLRIIGRIAFPIFAFMLAEGARYTRNKRRHILMLGGLALTCQVVFTLATGSLLMSILVTFTFSLLLIYLLDAAKRAILSEDGRRTDRILLPLAFFLAAAAIFWFCRRFEVDYGFVGCMVPVILSIPNTRGLENAPPLLRRLDTVPARIPFSCLGILLVALEFGAFQFFSALALPFLLLYSGKRGNWHMKYFFYIFYPAHLVFLYGLYALLHFL